MKEQIRTILKDYLTEIVSSIPISGTKSSQCEKFYDRLKREFPKTPDYLVNNEFYNCEEFEKWRTEDSERMFYDTE